MCVCVSPSVFVLKEQYTQLMEMCKRSHSDGGKSSGRGPSADVLAFSGLVGGDEIFQLFDNSVYKLLLVPFVFTELSEHVVLAAGVLHLL